MSDDDVAAARRELEAAESLAQRLEWRPWLKPLGKRWSDCTVMVGWGNAIGLPPAGHPDVEPLGVRIWRGSAPAFLEWRVDAFLTEEGPELSIRHLERMPVGTPDERRARNAHAERLLAAAELVGEVIERGKTGPPEGTSYVSDDPVTEYWGAVESLWAKGTIPTAAALCAELGWSDRTLRRHRPRGIGKPPRRRPAGWVRPAEVTSTL